ncbi:MAG: tRNA pseudouridine(38-40) synthase TruA, partial [Pedobacter sp.]
ASQFFFHADIDTEWDYDLVFRLNKLLPYNISVFDIIPVGEKQHARFDAVQRKYDYLIHTFKDPFLSHLSTLYQIDPDLGKMDQAVKLLPKYKDYRAFCTSPDKYEHTICNVSDARLFTNKAGNKFRFQITSNRYLTRMIRIIMGKLIRIGTGALSIDEFESYLSEKRTPALLEPAHPTGLYLSKVTYPYLDLQPRANSIIDQEDWTVIDRNDHSSI